MENGSSARDTDGDGVPDLYDTDNDNDGVPDGTDMSPFTVAPVGGAQGVGSATTNAVVSASILLLCFNYFITELFFAR